MKVVLTALQKESGVNRMVLKTGNIVSHSGALEWGAGKVLLVTSTLATIQFSDGKSRKIAASHFAILQPAPASSYTHPAEASPVVKTARAPRVAKKKKAIEEQVV